MQHALVYTTITVYIIKTHRNIWKNVRKDGQNTECSILVEW